MESAMLLEKTVETADVMGVRRQLRSILVDIGALPPAIGSPAREEASSAAAARPGLEPGRLSAAAASGSVRLGGTQDDFLPLAAGSLKDLVGIRSVDIEAIILKFLMTSGHHSGFEIAQHIRLPLAVIRNVLQQLKEQLLLCYKSSAAAGDFVHDLTEQGLQQARRHWEHSRYCDSVPVDMKDYVASVHAQSVRRRHPKVLELQSALHGLSLPDEFVCRLAQAVNSGLGLFLYGPPGNGKTTLACRLTAAFGETIWIPRTLNFGGSLIRLFDPNNHIPQPLSPDVSCRTKAIDERWVRIGRPTIVVGPELMLDSFDVRGGEKTGISDAPVHMKSNCGTLVIDDFGRQRVTPAEILNRWMVPLASRYDIAHLNNGRQFEFPVEQFVVFSTNLDPRELVDEAFLRRIPYKIDVGNPSEGEFRELFRKISAQKGIKHKDAPVDYLIDKHYKSCQREMRYCQPGDLLDQVQSYCEVLDLPLEITNEALEAAVKNYFS
jgi:hypothetical protein